MLISLGSMNNFTSPAIGMEILVCMRDIAAAKNFYLVQDFRVLVIQASQIHNLEHDHQKMPWRNELASESVVYKV